MSKSNINNPYVTPTQIPSSITTRRGRNPNPSAIGRFLRSATAISVIASGCLILIIVRNTFPSLSNVTASGYAFVIGLASMVFNAAHVYCVIRRITSMSVSCALAMIIFGVLAIFCVYASSIIFLWESSNGWGPI